MKQDSVDVMDVLAEDTLENLSVLTKKRRAFVLAYSMRSSETWADGPASCEAVGLQRRLSSKLLDTQTVRTAIMRVQRDLAQAEEPFTLADAAWIQQRLSIWANASILDFVRFDADGDATIDLTLVRDRPEVAQLIDSIEEIHKPNGDRVIKLKKISHARVIELLGKHANVSAFKDVVEHRDGDRAERIRRYRKQRRQIKDVTPKREALGAGDD